MKKRYLVIFIVLIIMAFRVNNVFAADPIVGGPHRDQSAPHIVSSPIDINFYSGAIGDPVFFKIVPASSGEYTFESIGNLDTIIDIYDHSEKQLKWLKENDGDSGGEGENFKVSINLNASDVYYISVYHYPNLDKQPDGSPATLQITGELLAPPTVTTLEPPISITNSSAEVGGSVVTDNGFPVNDRGIVYIDDSLNVAPTLENGTKVQVGSGTGGFSPVTLSSLAENTTYRYCSYAINSEGTSYGNIYTFKTLENVVPSLTNLNGDALIFEKETSSILIDKNLDATVNDSDSSHFDGGNLTVSIESGYIVDEDSLIIINQETSEGKIELSGSDVTYSGEIIGTFTGGTGNNTLVITFNNKATSEAISALLKSIAYKNSNDLNPSTDPRTIRLTVKDETGETSSPADVKVYFCSLLGDPVSALKEINLHGNTITLTVTGDTFSANPLDVSKFTLNHSPAGNLTISHAEKRDPNTVILTLAYIRTDFDADITNFSITASGDLFTYGFPLTTKAMPITAIVEDLPIGQSISIIPNTPSTNNRNVSLSLSAIHATQMIISENSNFSDANYEPYQINKDFVLSEGDGLKTVYVKFKNEDVDESTPISSTITLDTEAPTNTSISINSSSTYTNNTAVNLTLSATDASEMIISEDSSFNKATYVPFSNSTSFNLSPGDGTKTIYVKYKDTLGNETIPISDTIILDTQPPLVGSSGILSSSSLSLDGVTLNWSKANDAVTAENNLIYSIYQSKNSMNTINEVKLGTCIASNLKDITTKSITGLSAGETYYFNVLVQDEVGNEACYTTISVTTLSNSTISPTMAVFDKKPSAQADLQVTLALNGNTLDSISYNGAPLTLGADYLLSGSTVTIKKEFFATQPKDSTVTLVFTFSAGAEQTLTLTICDSTVSNSAINPTAASFDKNLSAQKDLTVTMQLNGNTLSNISNSGTPLVLNKDYTVSESTVTIKKEYLATQPKDSTVTLIFTFSAGASQTLNITLTDSTPSAVTVPDAPTEVTAVGGDGQATVSFIPSLSNGGSAITSYRVTSNPGGITVVGTSSPIIVKGLTTDTTYTFTVAAINSVGTGAESLPSNSITSVHILTDEECVEADKAFLAIGYAASDHPASVTQAITLPQGGNNGTTITWSSDKPLVITEKGTVVRTLGVDAEVVLTATITKNGVNRTKTFTVTVIKQPSNNGGNGSNGGSSGGTSNSGGVAPTTPVTPADVANPVSPEAIKKVEETFSKLSEAEKQEIAQEMKEDLPYTLSTDGLTVEQLKALTNNKFTEAELLTIAKKPELLKALGIDTTSLTSIVVLKPIENPVFKDVATSHWAAYTIKEAAKLGIVAGRPDGNFAPSEPLQVADTFTFLDKMLLRHNITVSTLPRSIVEKYMTNKDHWAFNYMASIGSKLSEKTLKTISELGNKPLTRELLAQSIYEITKGKLEPIREEIAFVDIADSPYRETINYCVRAGLFSGINSTHMAPNKALTRAELMSVLIKLDKKLK